MHSGRDASEPVSRDASQLSSTPLSSTRTCEDRVSSTRSSARCEDGDGLRCLRCHGDGLRCLRCLRCDGHSQHASTPPLSSYTRTKRKEIAQVLVGNVWGGEGSVSGEDGLKASVMSRGSHQRASRNGVDGSHAQLHLLIPLPHQHADASLAHQHASFASEEDMCSWHGSEMSGVRTCLASMSPLRSRQASDARTDTFKTEVMVREGSRGSWRFKGEHMHDCQGENISRSDAAWVGTRGLDHMSTSPTPLTGRNVV